MTVTNLAVGQQINLAATLNTKLEKPILQSEMGLDAQATATRQSVRWDEFSLKHNNDGSFKAGIITGADIASTTLSDAQVSATAAVQASKLAIQKQFNKSSVANPSATANTNGVQVDLLPANGYGSMVPLGMNIMFGGTFGAETVTAQVIATYSDATTATLSKTATATGTVTLAVTDFLTLFKDGVFINKLSVVSKSTIASSATNVTYNHYGHYM